MELRLLYQGPLHPNGSLAEKHAIRRRIHAQLSVFWQHPLLAGEKRDLVESRPAHRTSFERGGFHFVPLVQAKSAVCHLDVLLLRPGEPGDIIQARGDIDNRLKTLFDALRVPSEDEIPQGEQPLDDEKPLFFCLLEDDALVTKVSVETDRLLDRSSPPGHVSLVLRVLSKAKPGYIHVW